ncbi:MAG: ABC transporter permease [Chloroflexota bacterium]|nr:ABC transporter permease [Chloroflexota bacterium]
MNATLSGAVRVLVGSAIGKAGLALLAFLVAVSVFVLVTYPLDFGTREWSNPAVWADNPKAVPPTWLNLFPGSDHVAHATLATAEPVETRTVGSVKAETYRLPLSHDFDAFPTFISFSLDAVTFHGRPPLVTLDLERPDGGSVRLLQHVPTGGRDGEAAPYVRYLDTPYRILLSTEETVRSALAAYHNDRYDTSLDERDLRGFGDHAAFGTPVDGDGAAFEPLQGEYTFAVTATFANEADSMDGARVVVGGDVFGGMGSDSQGRDLLVGLLFGFPVALFIGLLASTLTTAIGASLGIMSGYLGGWVDTTIQRLADIVANVPLLPILIFMVIVLGSNLFLIILVLVAFSWPGLTILIRSMVLQLRAGQLVEATKALGASQRRVMVRHIFPQTAPYVFAQMIFFTPAAILAEAGLSFLGLGDPSIPTWGQILEQGFRTGAVYVGYWWWVLPPGLLIVLTAMAFVLLALAVEPVLNPRLRTMR